MTTLDHPRIPVGAFAGASSSDDLAGSEPASDLRRAGETPAGPLTHPRIGSAYSNEFDRQLRNRVQNIKDLAGEILDIDPADGEEFLAEYQVKDGAILDELHELRVLFACEMYARQPSESAGPK